MNTIGNRIRNRRIELGMSQDELAKKLGYATRGSITKIEKSQNDLPLAKIGEIAKALDCDIDYLLDTKTKTLNENDVPEILADLVSDRNMLAILMRYAKLSDTKQLKFLTAVDNILEMLE